MRRLRTIGAFLYDFVIGDDWTVAAAVAIGLAITYAVSHTTVPVWWMVPAGVLVVLPLSLWRVIRRSGRA